MNVIVISIDSLRKDHIGAFGNDWIQTPNIDKFAENSIIFDKFNPNAIPTIPFRRAMMMGREGFPHKVLKLMGELTGVLGWQPLDEGVETIQQVLQKAGYVTGFVTDVPHYLPPGMNFHRGFDSWQFIRGQECDPYITGESLKDPDPYSFEGMKDHHMQNLLEIHVRNIENRLYEEDCFAPQLFKAAEKWIERNARYYEKFFLYVDCFDPHEPWDPPRAYSELYDPGYQGREITFPLNGPNEELTEAEKNHMRALYAGEVTMVDRWLGHFMRKFELMGLAEDTAVLLLSDHGISLGEHNMYKKLPHSLYWELLDIPLMLMLPKGYSGQKRIADFVQEADIAPTMLGLLGLEKPGTMDGYDLSPVIRGESSGSREYTFGAYHTWAYIRDHKYHYHRDLSSEQSGPYLFDLEKDPKMLNNIAAENVDMVQALEAKLNDRIKGWRPPTELPKIAYQKSYEPENLRKAGVWKDIYNK